MRKTKLRQRNKLNPVRIVPYFLFVLVILLIFYFLTSLVLNRKIISPLSQKYFSFRNENIQDELYKAGISFSSVERADDSSYLITLSDGGHVIITPAKNIKKQISSLQLILGRLTIEGKRVKLIDFRYDRPVIRL